MREEIAGLIYLLLLKKQIVNSNKAIKTPKCIINIPKIASINYLKKQLEKINAETQRINAETQRINAGTQRINAGTQRINVFLPIITPFITILAAYIADRLGLNLPLYLWIILIVGIFLVILSSIFIGGDKNDIDNNLNERVEERITKIESTNNQIKSEVEKLSNKVDELDKNSGIIVKKSPLWTNLKLVLLPLFAGFLGALTFAIISRIPILKSKREIANSNQAAEQAIQDYRKSMTDILLDEEHRKMLFAHDNSVLDLARALTIGILRRLKDDIDRRGVVIDFLRDASLYRFIFKNASLRKIKLSGAELSFVNLEKANLEEVELQKANLYEANLQEADLLKANLQEADLSKANLEGSNLRRANLEGSNLRRANLEGSNLRRANLSDADLEGSNLGRAYLRGANLRRANLIFAENLTPKQIKLACDWEKAIYKENESENTKYIEELKKDKSSDPKGV